MTWKTTSLTLKWHQQFGSAFFDKVMNNYVSTLWELLIRETYIEGWSIHVVGMKCKYHKNLAIAIMHGIQYNLAQ